MVVKFSIYLNRRVFVMYSNQLAHPHSLLRVFVFRMMNFASLATCIKNAPSEVSNQTANAQADQTLHWAPKICFLTLRFRSFKTSGKYRKKYNLVR